MNEILFAGFGGQGILFIGKVMAYCGLVDGKQVSWMPSYGPEMRGGTANCHVIINDAPIGSPIITNPTILLVMNRPSFDKFEPRMQAGGTVVTDSSLIDRAPARSDCNYFEIPATKLASDKNFPKLANMVALGKMFKETSIVSRETVEKALVKCVPPSKAELLKLNLEAIDIGYTY